MQKETKINFVESTTLGNEKVNLFHCSRLIVLFKAELLGDPAAKQRPTAGISSKAFFVSGAFADNHINY